MRFRISPSHFLRRRSITVIGVVALAALLFASGTARLAATPTARLAQRTARIVVRVNQVGFPLGAVKTATALTREALHSRAFGVVNAQGQTVLRARVGPDRGAWNRRWRHAYALDFSALHTPGTYRIVLEQAPQIHSPSFVVGGTSYTLLAARELSFLREQRDGTEVDSSLLDRQPSHLADSSASVYRTPVYRNDRLLGGLTRLGIAPVDVAGGWADAGDYLKLVETASFVEDLLLYTLREYPSALGAAEPQLAAEARYGLQWLGRMWDQQSGVLRYQVGIGDGNARIEGDHDFGWRLPQYDETIRARSGRGAYYVRYRPVFQDGTAGAPISPNLAGRMAAAFGLCAQVFQATEPAYAHQCLLWGQTIFDRANTHPRSLVTTMPHDYYPEREWQDDLELGADELLRATATTADHEGLPHPDALYWFEQADRWGQAYMTSPLDGTDTFNLYDVGALAHVELMANRVYAPAKAVAEMQSDQAAVLEDLHDQLAAAERVAARDPFGIGYAYANDDTVSHLLGLSLEARFYDQIAGTSAYEGFAQRQLDAVLGQNAWGLSFVVGAGSRFPDCLSHQVANLEGSLTGGSPLLLGAVVPGPVDTAELRHLSASEGYRPCPTAQSSAGNPDPYAQFNGRGAAYEDNVLAFPTNEPSDDIAALALLAFAREAAG
ncbi:MAG TPA: glycoside hydrolase family 9 protein [Solirubrobacteraceae bacterium]|nr:glycoside hydrolase family 9 protein [Solirubrobacteraceae bacterium]